MAKREKCIHVIFEQIMIALLSDNELLVHLVKYDNQQGKLYAEQ